ncbi:MAG: hypothetical protein EON60_02465 [Alphaproteobacteria bacterium]|nr:MAG: hypothetical protein EON60_02465 [Alphaproteobacteria bacterium]
MKTKQGYVMNLKLRERILALMVQDGGRLTLTAAAAELGVGRRTLVDYMTKEMRAEIAARKARGDGVSLEDVDRAMMRQACGGNVAAARLVYMRMAQKGEVGPLPSLDDMEAELMKLKQLEATTNGKRDDETAGDAAAMGDGQAGPSD